MLTKLKQGTGRTTGYRLVTPHELDELWAKGRIVVETHRYGNRYAIDHQDLDGMRAQGFTPVVHIGNVADLRSLVAGWPEDWLSVLLWVPRDVCAERSRLRGDTDTPKRLTAWDETAADLRQAELAGVFHLALRTDRLSVPEAAQAISGAVRSPGLTRPCTREELYTGLDDLAEGN